MPSWSELKIWLSITGFPKSGSFEFNWSHNPCTSPIKWPWFSQAAPIKSTVILWGFVSVKWESGTLESKVDCKFVIADIGCESLVSLPVKELWSVGTGTVFWLVI